MAAITPDRNGLGPCGAGTVIYEGGLNSEPRIISTPVSHKSTAYHGEVVSVKIGLKHIFEKCKHIISDSQSTVITLINSSVTDTHHILIQEIQSIARALTELDIKVQISWVGGHTNVKGNEIADKAAKEGSILAKQLKISTKSPMETAKKLTNETISKHWQRIWDTSTTGDHLKSIQPDVTVKKQIYSVAKRKIQLVVHQIKIGRSILNNQDPIHKKEKSQKLCDNCDRIEDTQHFMLECSAYIMQRQTLQQTISHISQTYNIKKELVPKGIEILAQNPGIPKKAIKEIMKVIETYIDRVGHQPTFFG